MNQPIETFQVKQSKGKVIANGHFIQQQGEPFPTLYEGDTFTMFKSIHGAGKLDNETLNIDTEEVVGMAVMYYEMNDDFTGKTSISGGGTADYDLYQMGLSDASGNLYYHINHIERELPAGNYEPIRTAQYLTDQFSYSTPLVNSNLLKTNNALLLNTEAGFDGGVAQTSWPIRTVTNTSKWGPSSSYWNSTPWANFVTMDTTTTGGIPKEHHTHVSPAATSGSGTGLVVKIAFTLREGGGPEARYRDFFSIVSPGQGYALGDTITLNATQFAYWSQIGGDGGYFNNTNRDASLSFEITGIADGSAHYTFTPVGEAPAAASKSYRYTSEYFVGASEFDLEFNKDNNGAFAFDYLHTPKYDTASNPPQPAVQILKDGSGNWTTLDRASGVALVDLYPRSLWEGVMGFDVDNITVKAIDPSTGERKAIDTHTPTTWALDLPSFQRATTKSYFGLNGYLNAGSNSRAVPTTTINPVATTLTVPIVANEYQGNLGDDGHLLLQANVGLTNHLKVDDADGNARVIPIAAVLDNAYVTDGIVSNDIGSAVPYVHSGEPAQISSVEIKFLDPETLEVPSSLGSNNTVYFQIQRASK